MNIFLAVYRLYEIRTNEKKKYRFWLLLISIISLAVHTANYSFINTVENGPTYSPVNYYISRTSFNINCAMLTIFTNIKYLQLMKSITMRNITETLLLLTHIAFMSIGITFGCIDVANSPQLPPSASLITKLPFLYYAISSVFFGVIVFSFNIIQSARQADMFKSLFGQKNILWIIAVVGNISIFLQTIAWSLILWNNFTNSVTLWLGSISELCLNAIFFIENGATVLTKLLCSEQVDIAVTTTTNPIQRSMIVITDEEYGDLSRTNSILK
ncbi:hypothetical protein HDV06_002513 [Boothiomyces sp. JEL0866]|nr:hypothetical protein HDV06_002513 [Boothiomyces sp. JEL0866]